MERIPRCTSDARCWRRLSHPEIDFINEAEGPSARVAVELTPESARALAQAILTTLEHAEADRWLSETGEHAHAHGPLELAHAH
jgi:hypothetical protein